MEKQENSALQAVQKAIELSEIARMLAGTKGAPMAMVLAAYRNAKQQWELASALCKGEANLLMMGMTEQVRYAR